MKSRYDNMPGKEAAIANSRQSRLEQMHSAKDAFVKKQQAELSKMAGKAPDLKAEALNFNAYMCNNGLHAQELASDLTKGIDSTAFPVKKP
jgi:hypothetical protein